MKKIIHIFLIYFVCLTIISCGKNDDSLTFSSSDTDNTSSDSSSTTEDISISSSASDNSTVVFGQTYQHKVTTSGSYTGGITFSLSNQPDGMNISPDPDNASIGLIAWTPTKQSEIDNSPYTITITVTTASGYVFTQTYNLTVTGTCTSGNVLAIWTGDQRTSTDSSKFLGNITAYTDNASDNCGSGNNSDCTAENNYQYGTPVGSSENLNIGPTPSATKGNMFFYNQYDNTTHTYLFWMFGKGGASFSPSPNHVHLDVFTANNASSDNVTVSDDQGNPWETNQESQSESSGLYSSTYTGRYGYSSGKSDGGVIGPFSGSSYRIFIDLGGKSSLTPTHSTSTSEDTTASGVSGNDLGLGNLDSFKYWSKDNSSFSLGSVDNFTVGFKTSIECN